MEKIDLVLYLICGGFSLMLIMWKYMNNKFDKIDEKFDKIDEKFEKVNEKFAQVHKDIQELRTSLNRMEGAFYAKDCCMLKDEKDKKTSA